MHADLSNEFVGCLKFTKDKASKRGPHAKREGRVSTQNADLAPHQQTRRSCSLTNVKVALFLQNTDLRVVGPKAHHFNFDDDQLM